MKEERYWLTAFEQNNKYLPDSWKFICSYAWQDECFLCYEVECYKSGMPVEDMQEFKKETK